jgi:hypothetical protein
MAEYSEQLVDTICNMLCNSHYSIRKCCTDNGLNYSTFKDWINPNHTNYREYAATQYVRNKEEQILYLESQINDLTYKMAEDLHSGAIDPAIASAHVSNLRVQVDSLKWILSKLVPKKYGDKLDVTSDNKPVNVALSVADAKAISDKLNSEV